MMYFSQLLLTGNIEDIELVISTIRKDPYKRKDLKYRSIAIRIYSHILLMNEITNEKIIRITPEQLKFSIDLEDILDFSLERSLLVLFKKSLIDFEITMNEETQEIIYIIILK